MLSFLKTVSTGGNGKTGSSGDTHKSGSGGDTSGEDNKKSCNGAQGVKKRKKGKQPTPVNKMAKMTATSTTNSTSKLEPLGIIIPKTPEKPKDEEEKILEIPSMNSPLFKDVPSKKPEFSSDSSSSSGDSSSSDDSSSSNDDSDEEDEEKKEPAVGNNLPKAETPEESAKPRTPIKLTISNLGKPSAKVTSTASRELIDSNSSDSDTDVDDHDMQKEIKGQSNPVTESIQGNQKSLLSGAVPDEMRSESVNDAHSAEMSNKALVSNHTDWNSFDKDGGDGKAHCPDAGLPRNSVMNINLIQVGLSENCPDLSAIENNTSKAVLEKESTAINTPKEVMDMLRIRKSGAGLDGGISLIEPANGGNMVRPTALFKNSFSNDNEMVKPELNSASLRDSMESKYCPDGFILAPTLSRSPQHLKATLKISQGVQECAGQDKEDRIRGKQETETSSDVETFDGTVQIKLLENDITQSSAMNISHSFLADTEQNLFKFNLASPKNAVPDLVSESDKQNIEPQDVKSDTCEVKDQNLNIKINNSNEKYFDQALEASRGDASSPEINSNKSTVESARTSAPKSKETSVVSLSLSRCTTTKTSPSVTTSSKNSGSITSPNSRSCNKTTGFTNGIPDSENPFITWAKYDDDVSGPVSTALPASSLVQALARAPFPPLALAGESSLPQISPLGGAVPQLSPLSLAGLSPGSSQLSRMSPGSQLPRLSSPTSQRLRSSPSHSSVQQQLSPPLGRSVHIGSFDGSKMSHGDDSKIKSTPKSVKRTSRLSNIIDSLRTSKEKQAAGSSQHPSEFGNKSSLDGVFTVGKKSPLIESPTVPGQKSSPVFSSPLGSDQRSQSDRLFPDSLGFPHQISLDTQQAIRSSLNAARAQTINNSFNALKDDLDKGKKMLENLEIMKNGLLDPFNRSDPKARKLDNNNSQSRSKSSSLSLSSSSATLTSTPSLSRPSSRQSTKLSSQAYPSTSPSSSSSRTSTITTASSNNNFAGAGSGNNINSAMFQAAPSAALAAAHMELNAAAANILAFQHMYGMQDPYMMKTLMSNPLYLQRMMEFQKQAMDPLMLRQLELFEAAAAAEKSKNSKEQRAALNAQSILWQAQAASILQHQQMQQFQQLQLHHQQQLQQQVAAARELETRETIAAIMANKSNNFSTHTNKSSGSISTGQSAKSLMASASAAPPSSSSSSSSTSSSKRSRPLVPPSPSDIYSRDGPGLEKKPRSSHQASSHISNHTSYHPSSSSSNTTSSSASKHTPVSTKPSSSRSAPSLHPNHEFLDLPATLQLSTTGSPNLWGFPSMLQPPSVDMARMSRFFERPSETPSSSSSSSTGPAEPETPGAEVLDLSVKAKAGKT